MNRRLSSVAMLPLVLLASLLVLAACAGDTGPSGAAGTAGSQGAAGSVGPTGPAGPAGAAGMDGQDAADVDTTALQANVMGGTVTQGGTITIAGSGYKAGENVAVMLIKGGAQTLLGNVPTGDSGGWFILDKAIDAEPGVYTIQGIGMQGTTATGPLVVLAGEGSDE